MNTIFIKKRRRMFASYLVTLFLVIGFAGYIFNTKTSVLPEPSYTPEPLYKVELMTVRAYCPCELCCGKWTDGHTAWNNYEIQPGDKFVAADPFLIPFTKMVTVPGYNNDQPVCVLDRSSGGLEVFFDNHQEALEWGKRILEVKIER